MEGGTYTGLHPCSGSSMHGSSSQSSTHPIPSHDMGKEKEKSRLEIIVDQECLFLKGTGADVEPALLSGQVALYLAESTSIKEITLQFRGKAKLPASQNDSLHLNNSTLMYVVCNHEWSFLEGQKKHSHTLKAGRHFFPFQLQVGGSLPSSLSTDVDGGASITYKLRAHAARPGLSHNLQAAAPVHIVRSFAHEALEYQQTLEIENTWPDKLMYSIMIPHKAWAAGDQLTALVKFSPLAKGTRVLRVKTTINETVKVSSPQGCQESTRAVATAKHEIIDGKAVHTNSPWLSPPHANVQSISNTPPVSAGLWSSGPSIPHSGDSATIPEAGPSESSSAVTSESNEYEGVGPSNDVTTHITIPIPSSICASHVLEPLTIAHRIRWSIYIGNLDGHASELRCSLPIHLLDFRLLSQARSHTSAARRLLLGGPEVPPEEEEEPELPSYTAHVRDRVANMFLPDALAFRVTNRWVSSGISPTHLTHPGQPSTPGTRPHSGLFTPNVSHLPHAPDLGTNAPLEWVNSELLLSLSHNGATPFLQDAHSPPDSSPASQPESRTTSRFHSRHASRTGSPERLAPAGGNAGGVPAAGPNETYVHSGHANRHLPGLFQVSMKPGRSAPFWLPSRPSSHSNLAPATTGSSDQRAQVHVRPLDRETGSALLHRAFTEVPDYGVASRGFLGGVPPLTSMQGLPAYEEAER